MPDTFSPTDYQHMSRAIQLARHGKWTALPNPLVGCVIVKEGKVVGEGWHEKAGEAHAEIHALHQAGPDAKNATVYVTLEPCSHFGRTPPCANALVNAGVSRVIAAMCDPNPVVLGRGFGRLRHQGIGVAHGLLEKEARALNRGFIKRMETGRPFVRAKLAMSLDGRTAMASGESQWITGPDARSQGQQLRAASCAIVTGVSSVLADDSALTLRERELGLPNAAAIVTRQPLRVVLDSLLRTPPSAKVVTGPGQCLIVTTEQASAKKRARLETAGAEIWVQKTLSQGRVDLSAVMDELGRRGCNEVLVEAGATLAGAMLSERLLDEVTVFMAPVLMGSRARPLFQLLFDTMAQKQPLRITEIRPVGKDWRIIAVPVKEGGVKNLTDNYSVT